jgi:hypothetical protein
MRGLIFVRYRNKARIDAFLPLEEPMSAGTSHDIGNLDSDPTSAHRRYSKKGRNFDVLVVWYDS